MTARVGFVRDADVGYAALVILDEESGDTIGIQRSLAFDEQDRALGMDTYCVTRGGASHYGGLVTWRLAHGVLALTLSSAAAALELPGEISISVDEEGAPLIVEHLAEMLA